MKKSTINVQHDIWDTEYTVFDYGTHINVRRPITRWVNNSGSLCFERVRIDNADDMAAIRFFVANEVLIGSANNNAGFLTISDVLDGNRHNGVHITE